MRTGSRILLVSMVVLTLGCNSSGPSSSPERSRAFDQLSKAVSLKNQASELVDTFPDFESIPPTEFERLRNLWRQALHEAKMIDIAIFNAEEPGFGDAIQAQFVRGLDLCANGDVENDLVRCQLMLAEFGETLNSVKAKKRRP